VGGHRQPPQLVGGQSWRDQWLKCVITADPNSLQTAEQSLLDPEVQFRQIVRVRVEAVLPTPPEKLGLVETLLNQLPEDLRRQG